MIRKIGFNPKGAEIEEMFKRFLEDDLVDSVEFHEFLQMLEAKLGWGDDVEAEVTKAMGFLAHDKGGEDDPTGKRTCKNTYLIYLFKSYTTALIHMK